ncbi:benenodin family lasso peptide [Luteimonas fraxinea]|uniref:Benenodin family lasso peptide n=1 Tax=Luteimonas fraxinea TaxID=2901869 RepID=A0ABS8UFU3_9GAMM|nr:benenodin family lasso peptide [Luteimonas fraxinea]MCD9098124.1 benenodin family lasso peptide [Luteimonas fraxinea]MCD9125346.1 benenodin family lasso peptide [Luteimonas fraxinea]UHH09151.1 benenodin family lasso peptide [Luteimonas fraxinea]
MKTNDNIPADVRDEVIELGVASVETKGGALVGEDIGDPFIPGISES